MTDGPKAGQPLPFLPWSFGEPSGGQRENCSVLLEIDGLKDVNQSTGNMGFVIEIIRTQRRNLHVQRFNFTAFSVASVLTKVTSISSTTTTSTTSTTTTKTTTTSLVTTATTSITTKTTQTTKTIWTAEALQTSTTVRLVADSSSCACGFLGGSTHSTCTGVHHLRLLLQRASGMYSQSPRIQFF
jgi:hypothetical protein